MEKILVLNAGSTSVKFQLYNMDDTTEEVIIGGVVERIGLDGSTLIVNNQSGEPLSFEMPIKNHKEAMHAILNFLLKKYIKNTSELTAVAHRMGYGGKYDRCAVIDDEVMQELYRSIPLIPLHGPAIEKGIKAAQELLPNVMQTAVFDTAFHQTVERGGYIYALPKEYREDMGIRRYGFHGPSHKYVSSKAAIYLGHKGKFICCHLGGGASITAVKDGKSVFTTMEFTPMSGIMMSTRPGNIDPYIPLHIMKTQNKTADEVSSLLNKQCGLYALSGGHSDMRDILNEAQNGNEQCIFALNSYTYNIIKMIGSGIAVMGGLDALVFTAGIGEKSSYIRNLICEKLSYLGVKLDQEKNSQYPAPTMINDNGSAVKVLVIPTNEELMFAKETYELYKQVAEQEKEAI